MPTAVSMHHCPLKSLAVRVSVTCTAAAEFVPSERRDGCSGARAVDAARDVSRSVHWVFRSRVASDLRQSVSSELAQRRRADVDVADARAAERSGLLPRSSELHYARTVGGAPVLGSDCAS